MTPQLMQAIKLLQLSNLDLAAYVEGELERNPLLERTGENEARPEEPTPAPESSAPENSVGPEGGSPATGGSVPSLARSSSGFRSSSSSTKADRSRFESCSSLMACISCGVITSDWD